MFKWSINNSIRMKKDLFDMLQSRKGKQPPNTIQIFDHYNVQSSCYDRPNWQMHGMAWRFDSGGENRCRTERNKMNSGSLQSLSRNGTRMRRRGPKGFPIKISNTTAANWQLNSSTTSKDSRSTCRKLYLVVKTNDKYQNKHFPSGFS